MIAVTVILFTIWTLKNVFLPTIKQWSSLLFQGQIAPPCVKGCPHSFFICSVQDCCGCSGVVCTGRPVERRVGAEIWLMLSFHLFLRRSVPTWRKELFRICTKMPYKLATPLLLAFGGNFVPSVISSLCDKVTFRDSVGHFHQHISMLSFRNHNKNFEYS